MANENRGQTLNVNDFHYNRNERSIEYQGRGVPVKDFFNHLGLNRKELDDIMGGSTGDVRGEQHGTTR